MKQIVVGRSAGPQVPFDIREEVELWARKSGRHAKVVFAPGVGWMAKLSLRSNDKSLAMVQSQDREEDVEIVFFHFPNPNVGQVVNGVRQGAYKPLDIEQMGPSGVREFLEKGDTWSGRGEFGSLREAVQHASDQNKAAEVRIRQEAKDSARDITADQRRSRLKIPFLGVGVDIRGEKTNASIKESS